MPLISFSFPKLKMKVNHKILLKIAKLGNCVFSEQGKSYNKFQNLWTAFLNPPAEGKHVIV